MTNNKVSKGLFQNVKKDIMAPPAAQNAGTAQMAKHVINISGFVMAVVYHTF